MNTIYQSVYNASLQGKKLFAWLIDPDKFDGQNIAGKLANAEQMGVDLIFVGGSLLMENRLDECIKTIKAHTSLPVILFPGSTLQINEQADALLFLSLISGRNPDLLIGRHVEVSSILKKSTLEILPTGYMLVDTGRHTTASYISNTNPIPYHKDDIAINTALAGELLGLKLIYMDGGSGAIKPISTSMISKVKQNINLPLIVGGGIRTGAQVKSTFEAGADIVVVGTAIEENPDMMPKIVSEING